MVDNFFSQERFTDLIDKLPHSDIVVIGDFFLDEYLVLDKNLSEISIETGAEAYQVISTRKNPGVAGTVTNILRSMEVPVRAIGFSGNDGHGFELRRCLNDQGIDLEHFAIFTDRFTPTYTKPMLLENGIETEQSRQDTKNRLPLNLEHEKQLVQSLRQTVPHAMAVLAIDQAKDKNCGVITDAIRTELAQLAEQYPNKIFMADSRDYMSLFRNTIVKFNLTEASKMFGIKNPDHSRDFVDNISRRLFDHYRKPIILTLGSEGMQVTDRFESTWIPAIPISGKVDIVGAGDSVMASAGAALSIGASLIEAAIVGTITASIIVQQIGTTGTATRRQIRDCFTQNKEWFNTTIRSSAL